MAEFRTSKSTGLPPRVSANCLTDSSFVTSRSYKDTFLFLANCCNSSLLFGLRAVAITSHPSAAYRRANSNPSPRFAPVIKTLDMIGLSSVRQISGRTRAGGSSCGQSSVYQIFQQPFDHRGVLRG